MSRYFCVSLLLATLFACSSPPQPLTIGLDNHYNREIDADGHVFHYTWSDTEMTGYSQLGGLAVNLGADTVTVADAPSPDALAGLDVYIIVDPDTPQETPAPNYIDEPAINAIADWVESGGVLVLMANNTGNCEFDHLNRLAGRFGIAFNGDSRNDSTPETMWQSTLAGFPDHPLFAGVDSLFIKGISTLAVEPPAEAVYSNDSDVIMVSAQAGEGSVFAIGDPWLYNEYIDIDGWDNLQAAENLLGWLIGEARR